MKKMALFSTVAFLVWAAGAQAEKVKLEITGAY